MTLPPTRMTRSAARIETAAAHIGRLSKHLEELDWAQLGRVAEALTDAWQRDRTIFIAGNGGSAATAAHFASDLSKTTLGQAPRARRVRAAAMADNTALFTAWANDDGYERVFAEQLRNLARPQDVLVLISCSGSSPNVLAAARAAREMDVRVVAMTAPDTPLHDLADLPVSIPGPTPQVMEDIHLAACHALALELGAVIGPG